MRCSWASVARGSTVFSPFFRSAAVEGATICVVGGNHPQSKHTGRFLE